MYIHHQDLPLLETKMEGKHCPNWEAWQWQLHAVWLERGLVPESAGKNVSV